MIDKDEIMDGIKGYYTNLTDVDDNLRVKDMIWDVLDIEFIDNLTNEKFLKRMDTSLNKMAEILNSFKYKIPTTY